MQYNVLKNLRVNGQQYRFGEKLASNLKSVDYKALLENSILEEIKETKTSNLAKEEKQKPKETPKQEVTSKSIGENISSKPKPKRVEEEKSTQPSSTQTLKVSLPEKNISKLEENN